MPGISMPPTIELPGAFDIPTHDLELPQFKTPTWVPVPIYRDDIPNINNATPKSLPKKESQQETTSKKTKKSKPETTDEPPVELPPPPPLILPAPPPPPQLPVKLPPTPQPTIEFKEVQTVTIPFIEIDVPLPRTEIVVTAVSTAAVASVASVGGTLVATAAFKRIMQISKPLFNAILKKITKARGKKTLTWARQRLKDKPIEKVKGPLQ